MASKSLSSVTKSVLKWCCQIDSRSLASRALSVCVERHDGWVNVDVWGQLVYSYGWLSGYLQDGSWFNNPVTFGANYYGSLALTPGAGCYFISQISTFS
jgi:hypothetical protein